MQKSPIDEVSSVQVTVVPKEDINPVDPELAKYLNRDYWEQRKTTESPVSPSAPSPMIQQVNTVLLKVS